VLGCQSRTDLHQNFRIGRRMKGLVNLVYHFAILQGTLPWQPIKVEISAFSRTNLHSCAAILKRIAISQFRCQKIKWHEFLCILYNFVRFGTVTPECTLLKKDNFCGDTAKIGILHQISRNIRESTPHTR